MWPPEASRVPLVFLAALAASLLLTPIARAAARRAGFVAPPREDRWHSRPTALLGGPAIALSALAVIALALGGWDTLWLAWAAGALVIAALGLADDLLGLRPATKFVGQIIAALIPISFGLGIPVFHPLVSFAVALLWVVAITNALNLIDNMDGLAAGIAGIAAASVAVHAVSAGNLRLGTAAAALAGAALGFLVYNFQPASIFMGDCGSLFLGYSLGVLSLMDLKGRPLVSFSIIAVPLFVLAVPIFDTALVTMLRTIHGRSIAQGGRDHSSHRLVSLGLSERRAVFTLWAAAGGAGLLALALPRFPASVVVAILLAGTLVVYYFGAYLGSVEVYRTDPEALERARFRGFFVLDTFIAHKRTIADVGVDALVVCFSYLTAFLLRYEGAISFASADLIIRSLPFLLAARLLCAFGFGLYRAVPGAFAIHDVLAVVKTVIASSALFATGLVLTVRFENYSRAVLVIDGLLTLAGMVFARIALRSLREVFEKFAAPSSRRVLIVGAGSLGEAAAKLVRDGAKGGWTVVGFLDDSRDKIGRRLNGIPVFGPIADVDQVLGESPVEALILAGVELTPEERTQIGESARRHGVEVSELNWLPARA
ncbi:MAG: hypothetical protein WEB59_04395 [Thermoanaerobaculia bacterium]